MKYDRTKFWTCEILKELSKTFETSKLKFWNWPTLALDIFRRNERGGGRHTPKKSLVLRLDLRLKTFPGHFRKCNFLNMKKLLVYLLNWLNRNYFDSNNKFDLPKFHYNVYENSLWAKSCWKWQKTQISILSVKFIVILKFKHVQMQKSRCKVKNGKKIIQLWAKW
jgi:hypothetical protein